MTNLVRKILRKYNYDLVKINHRPNIPPDFEELHRTIYQKVADKTMTSPERIYSLIESVNYIQRNEMDGDIVECGVWKGGSMMAVAETLKSTNDCTRKLYLYDTFEGMSEPTEHDKTYYGEAAASLLNEEDNKEKNLIWAYSTLETVKKGMRSTNYPQDKIVYVKGKVEDTIPATLPSRISLLRLDTDWYESTLHEMTHLFPLLVPGGVLIIDDYGHWAGARKAIDEYVQQHRIKILLNRIDETGRIAIKQNDE